MSLGKILIVTTAVFAASVFYCPLPATAQDDSEIDIQVDCGPNASYNEEYKVCFCDNGYHASNDGTTCVVDDSPKAKVEPAIEYEEPAEEPAKQPEKSAPTPVVEEKGDDAVSAPPPAPKPRDLGDGEYLLRRGMTVKLELIETLSSQTHATGDPVYFKVVDEVTEAGYVLIEEGAEALGEITYAKPAKGWGRSGQLDMTLNAAKAIDGTDVPLTAFMTDAEDWSPYAAGKTLLGTIIAGPLGLTMGGGMKGKKVFIDKGTTLAVFVAEDLIIESDKVETVKKPVVSPTYSSSATAPPGTAPAADVEEQARKVLKGCFEACKTSEGDTFKACMNTCKTDCPDLCMGLEGADFTGCLNKCAAPGDGMDI